MRYKIAKIMIVLFITVILIASLSAIIEALSTGDGRLLKRLPEETCHSCHKTDKNAPSDPDSIKTHSSTNTGSLKWGSNWGVAGGKYGEFVCTTCHTAHNTKNIYLIRETITAPNAPTDNFPGSTVDFRYLSGTPGSAPYVMGDDTGGHAISTRVCEVCHSQNKYHNYNTANNTGGLNHNNAAVCTTCHSHKEAFKPGESKGGVDCSTCHSDLFSQMNSTSGYHHYMNNAGVSNLPSGLKYPVISQPASLGGTTDQNRRCLMCHVDHDIFRKDLNANNTIGRAANLRTDISVAPSNIADYTNTDFSNTGNGGVCLSCHINAQSKSYSQSDNTTYTPAIAVITFNSSSHQYSVTSTFKDSSNFNANCSKCHNDSLAKTKQTSTNRFGNHQSTLRRILATLGITAPSDPLEENFCFRCHSKTSDTNPGGGPAKTVAGKDYYGTASMSAGSEDIYTVLQKTYRHNVSAYSGLHRASPMDETLTYIANNKHVECEDCHNPHAAGAARHTEGSNLVSAVLKEVSGAIATFSGSNWTAPTSYNLGTATREYEICFKCHSSANTALTVWNPGWTDVALEFSPGNRSIHPVTVGLGDASRTNATVPKALTTPQMTAGWSSVGTQTMYCSDCHGNDAVSPAAQGPHGSSYKYMLKGTGKYWPEKPGGGLWQLNTTDASSADLFCKNCHPIYDGTWKNNVHSKGDHSNKACVICHLVIPHGGKRSRLIAYAGDPSPYNYSGNTARLSGFKKASGPTSYSKSNCYSTVSGCTTHTNQGGYDP